MNDSLPNAPALPHDQADDDARLFQQSLARFEQACRLAWAQGSFQQLLLAGAHGTDADLQRVTGRPVQLRGQTQLSVVFRHATKDITRNLDLSAAMAELLPLLGQRGFRNAHLMHAGGELQLAISKKGKASLRGARPTAAEDVSEADGEGDVVATAPGAMAAATAHNREKQRFIDQARPFLRELGVTDAQGRLVPAMARKWKQINKFVEVFSHALLRSTLASADPLHVVDFGSGKGYLTFALHDWLTHVHGVRAEVTGVELRPDLVALCQGVIDRLALQGMHYEQGDVRQYHPSRLDVMVALHACDIATDFAIHLGIRAGAGIILCSPCCHKQVRPQLLSPHPMKPILQHGIHLGQQAEMLTDGLRALLLDAAGYDTQVFEFVSLEHTNKNKMILAVRREQRGDPTEVLQQISAIKALYGIREQALEQLLRSDGLISAEG